MALGTITFKDGKKATLNDDGDWECDDPNILKLLELHFSLKGWYGSPSTGPLGEMALRDAAKEFGGKMEYLAKWKESPPGTIY